MGRKNKEDGSKREFYVVDDIGGIKMDRLWGIVEKQWSQQWKIVL